ncbi:MAG: hypothetical protein EOM05_11255, partial [Clostridia bacterium]|nr:hypothetical protein [Clostridia bacterium]
MKLVRPTEINDTTLNSTNVAENDYSVYSSSSTYATGNRVIVKTGVHKIYESLVDSNQGNYPPSNTTGTSPKWLEVGATNAWKMFDDKTNTQTVNTGTIEIEIEPGRVNTIACLNVEAKTVTVEMVSGVDIVYSKTKNMQEAVATTWYEYFFEPIKQQSNALFLDVPIYGDATTTVTIDNALS